MFVFINRLAVCFKVGFKAIFIGRLVTDTVILVYQLLRQDLRELQELVNTIEPVKS